VQGRDYREHHCPRCKCIDAVKVEGKSVTFQSGELSVQKDEIERATAHMQEIRKAVSPCGKPPTL
jgi:hypothetical protein